MPLSLKNTMPPSRSSAFITAGVSFCRRSKYRLAKKWELFADYKKVWLAVDAKGLLSGGVPVTARVKLDPSFGRNQVSLLLGHRTLNSAAFPMRTSQHASSWRHVQNSH